MKSYKFEMVKNFKYLGAIIGKNNGSLKKVKRQLIEVKMMLCVYIIFQVKVTIKNIKSYIKLGSNKPVVLYAFNTRATIKSEE